MIVNATVTFVYAESDSCWEYFDRYGRMRVCVWAKTSHGHNVLLRSRSFDPDLITEKAARLLGQHRHLTGASIRYSMGSAEQAASRSIGRESRRLVGFSEERVAA